MPITKIKVNNKLYQLGCVSEEEKENMISGIAAAKKTANEALVSANNSVKKKTGRVLVPANNWVTVVNLTHHFQYASFILNFGHNYQNDNISLSTVKVDMINVSAHEWNPCIDQISNNGGTSVFDAVRVTNDGVNSITIDIHNNSDSAKLLEVDITNNFIDASNNPASMTILTMPLEVSNAEDGNIVKVFDIVPYTGIIADRAINDGNGNNIAKALSGKLDNYEGSAIFQGIGWKEIAEFEGSYCSGILEVRRPFENKNGESLMFSFSFSDGRVIFNQLCDTAEYFFIDMVGIKEISVRHYVMFVHYNSEIAGRVFWNLHNTISDGNVKLDGIELQDWTGIKVYNIIPNAGIIAERATYDVNGNVITETYATKTALLARTMTWNRVTTEEELNALIQTTINSLPDDTSFEFCVGLSVGDMILSGGGTWHITGYKSGEKYAFIEAKSYNNAVSGSIRHYQRNLIDGKWSSWYHVNYS